MASSSSPNQNYFPTDSEGDKKDDDWISAFVAPCTSADIEEAARRQGPRTYFPYRFQREPNFFIHITSERKLSPKPLKKNARVSCIEKWDKKNSTVQLYQLDRPPFQMELLCQLALKNSPMKEVTAAEIVSFIRHHFSYYRFFNTLRKQVLKVLNSKNSLFVTSDWKEFHCQKLFRLKEGVPQEIVLDQFDQEYAKKDARGEAFFSRMISGDVGLPRQLFYHIIGHQNPSLAGPENSALFYHLLGIKQIPEKNSSLFKVHFQSSKAAGMEPKFMEHRLSFDIGYLGAPENLTSYGDALLVDGDGPVEKMVDSKEFFKKIGKYFELQKEEKSRGLATWRTPNAE